MCLYHVPSQFARKMNLIFINLFVFVAAADSVSRAEIETCSGCKLNRLPDVKRFVTDEESGALSFASVTRKLIPAHNPDIVFYSVENMVVERIDMTKFTFDDLVSLLISRGFVRKYSDL